MKQELLDLRKCMLEQGIDLYYAIAGDPHGSEYLNDHYKFSEYLSGLTSENETLVVTADGAWIWTDGRYFLQADRQLAGSGIQLMKMGEEGVPTAVKFMADKAREYLNGKEDAAYVIGFDGKTVPASLDKELRDAFQDIARAELRWDTDLSDAVWKSRPEIEPSAVWALPISSAGRTAEEKITDMRAAMADRGADILLLSDLMETAWLLNLRGADIAYTPVFFSYIMLTQQTITLYIMDGALPEGDELESLGLPEELIIKNYDEVYADLSGIPAGKKIWMDLNSANYALSKDVPCDVEIISEMTPASLAKTVKNDAEIRSTINAHIKDGVAMVRFIKWIKEAVADGSQTEISAADHLEALRREQEGCFDLSFETISGYGPDGAVIHYAPTPETDLAIKPEGFLLVDSGGQYIDGTTDITRTIAVGPLTQEMITNYTLVLKSHIAFSRYVITPETTHKELDACPRAVLLKAGLDYAHGVSHGVGHVLSVHEGPAGVRRTSDGPADLKAGMIMSNEPGVYLAGKYGIRIENEILLKDNGAGALISEPITLVPYERAAIDTGLLTDEEIAWVDAYHAMVREIILPRLSGEDAAFLLQETEPLKAAEPSL